MTIKKTLAYEELENSIWQKTGQSVVEKTKMWAGPDLNRRSSPREGDVLAELDYRPSLSTFKREV